MAHAQAGECTPEACPPLANPRFRRNVYTLSDGEIALLRRGVAVIKARGPSDPTSWAFQENMQAVPALVGSIVRAEPHSGGAEVGFVASWVAVKRD